MIFFPQKEFVGTPDLIDLKYEDVYLNIGESATLHGWYVEPNDSTLSDKVILFCHGNAGNISHRMPTLQFLSSFGFRILIFDYQSYGLSTGELTENNIYNGAEEYYNWLKVQKNFKAKDIIIFGRSLGGAVGIELATKVDCGGIIIESSLTSTADLARKIFPIFPVSLLLKYKFDSIAKIQSLKSPVLIIHSKDDDIIPFEMGQKLFENASEPKKFLEITGFHNDRSYFNNPEYINTIKEFISNSTK